MDLTLLAVFSFFVVLLFLVILVLILANSKSSANKRDYGIESVTMNGQTVRSYSEKKIADYFQNNNIRYLYEQSGDYHIHNPDFYLPDYDLYVEFWGLVNAEDNWTRQNYIRNMRRKMAIYHKRNKRLISLYPDNLENLDWIFRAKFRKVMGYELNS